LSRSHAKLEAARRSLLAETQAPAAHCFTASVDVSDELAVKTTCDHLLSRLGDVSLVVSSAGYTLPGYCDALTCDDYAAQWRHNCLGMLHVVKTLLPYFRARGGGQFWVRPRCWA